MAENKRTRSRLSAIYIDRSNDRLKCVGENGCFALAFAELLPTAKKNVVGKGQLLEIVGARDGIDDL